MTSSVIYYSTGVRKNEIYLLSMSPDVAMINHNAKSTMFSWAFKILVIVLWTIILLPIDLKLSYSGNGIEF